MIGSGIALVHFEDHGVVESTIRDDGVVGHLCLKCGKVWFSKEDYREAAKPTGGPIGISAEDLTKNLIQSAQALSKQTQARPPDWDHIAKLFEASQTALDDSKHPEFGPLLMSRNLYRYPPSKRKSLTLPDSFRRQRMEMVWSALGESPTEKRRALKRR